MLPRGIKGKRGALEASGGDGRLKVEGVSAAQWSMGRKVVEGNIGKVREKTWKKCLSGAVREN